MGHKCFSPNCKHDYDRHNLKYGFCEVKGCHCPYFVAPDIILKPEVKPVKTPEPGTEG